MPTPTVQTYKPKASADMLTYIQGFYPTLTNLELNLDGSLTLSWSDTPPGGAADDIIDILTGANAWEQV